MNRIIKIGLSILLLCCLAEMPYGFYQLVRFLSLIGFGFLAFEANQKEKQTEMIIFIILAVLFQPLIKISLGRSIWNIIDVVVAIGLLFSSLDKTKNSTK